MEPNTNEATAPKRLKTGGKKPIIIIGVIVAVLLAAYVGLCAYANSLDIFYPNTTINGVDVAGLTAEQAAERLRQEIPEETVEFYLPLADETGDGESAPEGDMLYGADPDAVCTYRELGITEELDYEVSAQSAFDAVQGRSSFFVKGWEYLACLVGADGQLGVVLEPEEDIFQVKMEQLSEQFSREAQDASYEVTEDAVEITKALNGLSVSAADLARTAQERWTGSGNGAAASVFVNNARILPAKTLTAQEIYDDCSGVVKNASYDKETGAIVPEEAGADFDVDEAQRLLDVTKESLHRGIEMACGGNRVGDIGHAVQSYVEENGFSVVRTFVGHGVGKELHEDPEVPNFGNAGRGPRLVPGMCIAVEPMVCQYKYAVKTLKDGWTVKTKDGGLAAHFEHSIAILKDRTEIMTRSWDDPNFDPDTFSFK